MTAPLPITSEATHGSVKFPHVTERSDGFWINSGSGYFGPFSTSEEAQADLDQFLKSRGQS